MCRWSVQKFPLSSPSLEELVPCITAGLQSNFKEVSVEVTECPDLRQEPFRLAAEGLSGNARIADIGGQRNFVPTLKLDRKYSMLDMAKLMEMSTEKGFLLGAGAGPFHVLGMNAELIPNLGYEGQRITNLTHYAKVDGRGGCMCEKIISDEFALIGNLFGSEGRPGPVLKIFAKTRTGKMNFTHAIQRALKAEYGERTISMGGTFVIRKGKANLHVMPDFPKTPFKSRGDVLGWLRYFDMSAPLVCLSVFHSHDPGLELNLEHTHCFSSHGEGGHYHDDTTPEEVEYEAFLNVASTIYRIDGPDSM
jgi:hypothetical protein